MQQHITQGDPSPHLSLKFLIYVCSPNKVILLTWQIYTHVFIFNFIFIAYWSIVDLQCCVNFRCNPLVIKCF